MTEIIANPSPEKVIGRASECMRRLFEAGLTYDALQMPITDPEMRHRLVGTWNSGCREPMAIPSDITSPFFANKEVASNREYPAHYVHKPVCEQLVLLAPHLPRLNASQIIACSKESLQLPLGAEGAFAIPKWQKVVSSYNEATEVVFGALAKTRTFKNWRQGELGSKYLKLSERTECAHQILDQKYPGDYMLVFAQFGQLWRGKSVCKVRVNYAPHEFRTRSLRDGYYAPLASRANRR